MAKMIELTDSNGSFDVNVDNIAAVLDKSGGGSQVWLRSNLGTASYKYVTESRADIRAAVNS